MYTAHDVCTFLGISKTTLLRWEKEGKIILPRRGLSSNREYSIDDIKSVMRNLTPVQLSKAKGKIQQIIAKHFEEVTELQKLLSL